MLGGSVRYFACIGPFNDLTRYPHLVLYHLHKRSITIMNFLRSCMSYACPYDPADLEKRRQPSSQANGKYWERQSGRIAQTELADSYIEPTGLRKKACKFPCRLLRYRLPCPLCYLRRMKEKLKQYVVSQKKPYSAVSVQIDRLTSEQFEEDDWSGIIDLIEVIRIQASGPTEAARALRKKL